MTEKILIGSPGGIDIVDIRITAGAAAAIAVILRCEARDAKTEAYRKMILDWERKFWDVSRSVGG